jgi:MFS family permease
VSDLLTAAASALDVPEALVQRSAAARATANGTAVDDVLAAWAGGAPVTPTAAASAPVDEAAPPAGAEVAPEPAPEPAPAEPEHVAEREPAAQVTTTIVPEEPEPEKRLDPVPLARRVRTAARVGAWTGAGLGLIGFVVATTWWASTATVTGEVPFTPVIQVSSNGVIIGAALVSIVFGAVIASSSRAAAAWANPGMQLSSSPGSTAWVGALIGLLLGVIAGAALTSGFGVPVEGAEGLVQLPALSTIAVMLIGGAVLGGLTAAVTQLLGVPVSVSEDEGEEVEKVRRRLGAAFGIPLVGLLLLAVLVLPFAWALLESNHLTPGGAAIVGILTAAGILAYASLAGNRPNVRITFGELLVALAGIGTVLVFIFAVLFAMSPEEEQEEPPAEPEAAVVLVIG